MGIAVDIIIVAIIGIFTFLGFNRGLLGVVFKICSLIIAIILSFILYKPVSTYIIENTTLDNKIESSVVQIIEGKKSEEASSIDSEKEENTPKVLQNYINQYVEDTADTAKENIASYLSKDITRAIIHICTIILIFILVNILLFFAKSLSDKITKLPVISQFNKVGGTLYGIIEGFLIVYLVLALISLFMPVSNSSLIQAITSSYLGGLLYNNNLLLLFLF